MRNTTITIIGLVLLFSIALNVSLFNCLIAKTTEVNRLENRLEKVIIKLSEIDNNIVANFDRHDTTK